MICVNYNYNVRDLSGIFRSGHMHGRYLTDKSHVIFIDIALAISVSISNYSIHQVRLFPHK